MSSMNLSNSVTMRKAVAKISSDVSLTSVLNDTETAADIQTSKTY